MSEERELRLDQAHRVNDEGRSPNDEGPARKRIIVRVRPETFEALRQIAYERQDGHAFITAAAVLDDFARAWRSKQGGHAA